VIVIQENRTVDNLFQGFPGADTQSWGPNAKGGRVALKPVGLAGSDDPSHSHNAFRVEENGGAMNGWSQEICGPHNCKPPLPLAYVPQSEAQPYWSLASAYGFADEFFQTNQGPSYPAHQYLLSGTSSLTDAPWPKIADNTANAGCDAPPSETVKTIDANGIIGDAYPCRHATSILGLLDAAGLSWRYYQSGVGGSLWHGPDSLYPIWSNQSEFNANVVANPAQFLTDVGNGSLAAVTYITPTAAASDHAQSTDGTGPAWVTSVVNAIGASPYWGSTAIFITWDDWGGWFDHVVPPVRNTYELSFRVPLIVVSPYAKVGYVSHTTHEFGSILHYTEETLGLPSMNTTDAMSDDLSDMFDYTQTPTPFIPFPAKKGASYFLGLPQSNAPIDY
jgi:phospholipase C